MVCTVPHSRIYVCLEYFVTETNINTGMERFELKSILKRGTKSFYSLIESLANTHK